MFPGDVTDGVGIDFRIQAVSGKGLGYPDHSSLALVRVLRNRCPVKVACEGNGNMGVYQPVQQVFLAAGRQEHDQKAEGDGEISLHTANPRTQ